MRQNYASLNEQAFPVKYWLFPLLVSLLLGSLVFFGAMFVTKQAIQSKLQANTSEANGVISSWVNQQVDVFNSFDDTLLLNGSQRYTLNSLTLPNYSYYEADIFNKSTQQYLSKASKVNTEQRYINSQPVLVIYKSLSADSVNVLQVPMQPLFTLLQKSQNTQDKLSLKLSDSLIGKDLIGIKDDHSNLTTVTATNTALPTFTVSSGKVLPIKLYAILAIVFALSVALLWIRLNTRKYNALLEKREQQRRRGGTQILTTEEEKNFEEFGFLLQDDSGKTVVQPAVGAQVLSNRSRSDRDATQILSEVKSAPKSRVSQASLDEQIMDALNTRPSARTAINTAVAEANKLTDKASKVSAESEDKSFDFPLDTSSKQKPAKTIISQSVQKKVAPLDNNVESRLDSIVHKLQLVTEAISSKIMSFTRVELESVADSIEEVNNLKNNSFKGNDLKPISSSKVMKSLKDIPAITLAPSIFRAYDIRGKSEIFSQEASIAIGAALAQQFTKKTKSSKVVVGWDARTTSPAMAKNVIEGLTLAGMDVINIDMLTTPIMHYAAHTLAAGNGVMITASHNPANYNGIKWVLEGMPPSERDIQQIDTLIQAGYSITTHVGAVIIESSIVSRYRRMISSDTALLKPLNIAIDGMNGAIGEVATKVFTSLGCTVVDRATNPDGNFPEGNPDPSEPNRLSKLSELIVENNCDIGFAFDGDADRLVVLDNKGKMINPDYIIMLLADIALATKAGGEVYLDVKCSRSLAPFINELGGIVNTVRTGNTFVKQAVLTNAANAALGAEIAGHYVLANPNGNFVDDALFAALSLVELLANNSQTLAQYLGQLPQRVATADTYIDIPITVNTSQFMTELAQIASNQSNSSVLTLDGVRIDYEDGFALIRASNSSPKLSVRIDAPDINTFNEIKKKFIFLIQPISFKLAMELEATLTPMP